MSTRREKKIKEAYLKIREILPSAVISIKHSEGIPGLEPHKYIEVDP